MRIGLFAAPLLLSLSLAGCSAGPSADSSATRSEALVARLEVDLKSFVHQLEVQLSHVQGLTEQIEKLRGQLARAENDRKVLAMQVEMYQTALKKPKRDW
jgi:TolA-binding protein